MPRPEPKEIPIEELKAVLDYEPLSGLFYWKARPHPWSRAKAGDEAGSHDKPYRRVMVGKRHFSLHRLAYAFVHGWAPEIVDHRDGDTWNNREDNLRAATNRQNQQNRKAPRGKKVKSAGVSVMTSRAYTRKTDGQTVRYQRTKPYTASIKVNGKRVQLGQYATEQEAALVYEKAAIEFFGEFACSAGRLPSVSHF